MKTTAAMATTAASLLGVSTPAATTVESGTPMPEKEYLQDTACVPFMNGAKPISYGTWSHSETPTGGRVPHTSTSGSEYPLPRVDANYQRTEALRFH